jgi:hypothetical protein
VEGLQMADKQKIDKKQMRKFTWEEGDIEILKKGKPISKKKLEEETKE